MIRKNLGEIVWYEFELLQGYPLVHGIFTRRGGVSEAPFDSLNVGDNLGDDKDATEENKRRMANALGINLPIFLKQSHSDRVHEIGETDEADGMVTGQKEIPIAIRHADCQAALFYDPVHHALANVHAGWRGNVQNIYAKTVEKMELLFGTRPEELIVCISPSLGPRKAEFINYERELPRDFWIHKNETHHFNLWNIAKGQLIAAKIPEAQIEIASLCTFENEEDFFSFRRSKTTGRNATVASLC